jgi:hypothetical protein
MAPLGLSLLLLSATPPGAGQAAAQERAEEPAEEPGAGLDLGDLLRPRGRFESTPTPPADERGRRDEEEWRRLFAEARAEVAGLEEKVALRQEKIRQVTGDAGYNFSPIGAGESTDPEVQRLRSELKRDRRSLDTARARLRDLDVEASLAGVPDAWREPAPTSPRRR